MLDATGYAVLGIPEVCPQPKDSKRNPLGIPSVWFGIFSTSGVRLGRVRYNYASTYEETPNYIRMTFVPENKMLFCPSQSTDANKSMVLLQDVLALMALAGKLDTMAMFGVDSLIPYNVVRDYGSDIDKEINTAAIGILKKFGFMQDERKGKEGIYLYHPSCGHSLTEYKLKREKEMKYQLLEDSSRILARI